MRKIIVGMLVAMLSPAIYGGCKTRCVDDYQAAKADCSSQHGAPDDAGQQLCLTEAKDEYENCVQECGQ